MIRYLVAFLAVIALTTDASACSRRAGRAHAVIAAEVRLVTAPVRFVAAPISRVVTRERHRVVTRGVATPVIISAPTVVKAPCPPGGCPLATPPKVTTTETKTEKKTVIDPTLPKK